MIQRNALTRVYQEAQIPRHPQETEYLELGLQLQLRRNSCNTVDNGTTSRSKRTKETSRVLGTEKFPRIQPGAFSCWSPGRTGRRRDTGPSRGTKNHPSASLFAVDIWSPPGTGKRKSSMHERGEQVDRWFRVLWDYFFEVSARLTGPGHSLLYDGKRLSGCSGIGYTCFAITLAQQTDCRLVIRPR